MYQHDSRKGVALKKSRKETFQAVPFSRKIVEDSKFLKNPRLEQCKLFIACQMIETT